MGDDSDPELRFGLAIDCCAELPSPRSGLVRSQVVFVVALTRLTSAVEEEAGVLAPLLGKTAYEVRLVLHGGLPAVLLTTVDRDAASRLLAALRARGHGAVGCDVDAVHFRRQMVSIGQFRFEGEHLVTTTASGTERLPYADVLALVRGLHKRSSTSTREVQEKQFAVGRALLSGGMATRKTVSKEVVDVVEQREEVLYLFRRDGSQPWILVDAEAKYQGLAERIARTQRENFLATVECLRAMCPEAAYDERLLASRRIPERVTRGSGTKASESSSSDGVDLLAHLIALAVATGQA